MKEIKKGVPRPGPQEQYIRIKDFDSPPVLIQEEKKDELFIKNETGF